MSSTHRNILDFVTLNHDEDLLEGLAAFDTIADQQKLGLPLTSAGQQPERRHCPRFAGVGRDRLDTLPLYAVGRPT
jgi:hypothetical protein